MNILTNVFKRCEIILNSNKTYKNPFMDVEINAAFTHEDGTVITLPGFWNGENEWKVRFSPNKLGKWSYIVTCTDKDNTSLCDSGTIEAAACEPTTDLERHGYVTIVPGQRYMSYADGTPFFYLGDTHWQMPDYERLHECNYPGCTCGSQFKHLVDDRVKKGFTVYQTYFDSAESDGGGNKRQNHWWTDFYTLINPQAFNESMDVMIEYLASQGLTTAMGFGVHTSTIVKMHSDPKPILAFVRYCVARYACYPVIWITGQEITNETYNTFEIWKSAAALVSELDGYHRPNGAHMYPMESSDPRAKSLDEQPWHQWWTLQAGHGGFNRLQARRFYRSYYENEKVKPFIETECQYEDIYCGGFNGYDASRIGAWQAVQSGSAGFTYGVTGVWAMGWNQKDDQGWLTYSPEPWYIGMEKPGSSEMTYLRKFFEYVGWSKLTPCYDHHFGSFEMRKYVSISHIGQDVIIYYFFSPDTETGVLRDLKPNTRYQARWFDPIEGNFIDLPDIITENGEYPVPYKPSARDWTLLLNTYDLGPYETEVYPPFIAPIAPQDAKLGEEIKIISVKASSEDEAHPAANLIDGNPDTFWRGFAPCTSQTLILDLGAPQDVGYLSMECEMPSQRFIRFRTYGSNDGENYTLLAERAHDCVAVGGPYKIFHDPLHGKYRYIKLFINSSLYTPQLELTKLAVYKKSE